MKKRFDLKSEVREVVREIMDYKWLESEKAGHDIGLNKATQEWIDIYYGDWFKSNAEKFYSIKEK